MNIKQAIQKLAEKNYMIYSKVCIVRETNDYFLTIVVEPTDYFGFNKDIPNKNKFINDVRLTPVVSAFNKSAEYSIPKIGSYVIINYLSRTEAYASLLGEVAKKVIKANDTKIELKENVLFDNMDLFTINNSKDNMVYLYDAKDVSDMIIHNINEILLESHSSVYLSNYYYYFNLLDGAKFRLTRTKKGLMEITETETITREITKESKLNIEKSKLKLDFYYMMDYYSFLLIPNNDFFYGYVPTFDSDRYAAAETIKNKI